MNNCINLEGNKRYIRISCNYLHHLFDVFMFHDMLNENALNLVGILCVFLYYIFIYILMSYFYFTQVCLWFR